MKTLGFTTADILLPKCECMTKWSCVACDQYTSEPEYWETAANIVGNCVSTLNLMLPEVYLENPQGREEQIPQTMQSYLNGDVFKTVKDSFVYVERTLANGKVRYGIVGAVDLEQYDFSLGTTSLIRPTEATVVSRLPARTQIRKQAPLEMPHIMLLVDDKQNCIMGDLKNKKDSLEKLYDFELMQNSGAICGYKVCGDDAKAVIDHIKNIFDADPDEHPMLFAMGDGNHSLAAAKQYYEQLKQSLGDDAKSHPARFALAELVNIYDSALDFEPIHRVFFNVDTTRLMSKLGEFCKVSTSDDADTFTVIVNGKSQNYTFKSNDNALAVGVIQNFLDDYEKEFGGYTDYIHGDDVVKKLCSESADRVGFIFKPIDKSSFFDVIKKDGILPRKTFSMGNACDKRFYLECRKISL